MSTRHSQTRVQQRGILRLMDEMLDRYGREAHDGHGAIVIYLNKDSVRQMERDLGCRFVARISDQLDVYKVQSTDGSTLTMGHRTRRIWKKR